MTDITLEQARMVAERWLDGDAGVYEFDLGYVLYPRGPLSDGSNETLPGDVDTARGVIDRTTGELSMWPCVPPDAVAGMYRRHRANQGPIYHIAFESDWTAARAAGEYLVSTRDVTLADAGYIHASFAHQVPVVAEAVYADVTDQLVVLVVDTKQLVGTVRVEPADESDVEFPHVYGPINADAVIDVVPLKDFGPWLAGELVG